MWLGAAPPSLPRQMNPNSKEEPSGKRGKQNQAPTERKREERKAADRSPLSPIPIPIPTPTESKLQKREREYSQRERWDTEPIRKAIRTTHQVEPTRTRYVWRRETRGSCHANEGFSEGGLGGVNDRVTDRSMIDVHLVRCTCTGNELPLLQLERKLLLLERQWLHILQ